MSSDKREFQTGDRVEWDTPNGVTVGTVVGFDSRHKWLVRVRIDPPEGFVCLIDKDDIAPVTIPQDVL